MSGKGSKIKQQTTLTLQDIYKIEPHITRHQQVCETTRPTETYEIS